MSKIVKYGSKYEFYKDVVIPAKTAIPEWYKNAKNSFYTDSKKDPERLITGKKNFKMCMPFLDSLSSGYLILSPADLLVTKTEEGLPFIQWYDTTNEFVDHRKNPDPKIPVPHGCYPDNFVWKFPAAIKLPKGYNGLFTHPLNRYDLPFVTTSGIIDGNFAFGFGNYPFFVKENFEGVIKQGTPIAQLIPFKQESWNSKEDESVSKEAWLNLSKSGAIFSGWYKNTFWNKKNYD